MLRISFVFAMLVCSVPAYAGVVVNPRECVSGDEPVLDTCTTPLDESASALACDSPPEGSGSTLCNLAYPDKCQWIAGVIGDRTHGVEHMGGQSQINPPESTAFSSSYNPVVISSHVCAEYWKCRCVDLGIGLGTCRKRLDEGPITQWILNTYDLSSTEPCVNEPLDP